MFTILGGHGNNEYLKGVALFKMSNFLEWRAVQMLYEISKYVVANRTLLG